MDDPPELVIQVFEFLLKPVVIGSDAVADLRDGPAAPVPLGHQHRRYLAAVDRNNQATTLLDDAGILYNQVFGAVQDRVDRLAGVSDSVLPRFFSGDLTAADWVSEPGENNGGLRWLREKVAELSEG